MREVLGWLVAAGVILVACSGSSEPAPKPKASFVARAEAAAQAQPARHRSIPVGSNELVIVDVPVAIGPKVVGAQPCFVWRDAEFKTATMSCPNGDPMEMPVSVGAGQLEH